MSHRDKLREYFSEMVVYKDNRHNNLKDLIPQSFLRDWLLKRYQDEDGNTDLEGLHDFVKRFKPPKDDWPQIKARLRDGESIKLLAKVDIDVNLRSNTVSFSLPDYDVGTNETEIESQAWEASRDELVRPDVQWGQIELVYREPSDPRKRDGKIMMRRFSNFCPYTLDLEYYKDMRSEFTLDEWIDVLLEAMDYNAAGYTESIQKYTTLSRLLIFAQNNLNMIELAPKGTGKSYMFGNLSKYGCCIATKMSRAALFYNLASHKEGPIFRHDYVAIDEVQTGSVNDMGEMRTALKVYLEDGVFKATDGALKPSKAGMILLGNIPSESMDTRAPMFDYLQEVFRESALIDRFKGFIQGWYIPRVHEDLKMNGWALNTEYFSSILHMLRSDPSYDRIVDELIECPDHADTRDTNAVKGMCSAWLKLLFPNVRNVDDILYNPDMRYQFNDKCLRPAKEARSIIRYQLGLMDPGEYKNKPLPNYQMIKP